MGSRRKFGFTLIELLVVIAIIGILAAMLFPVFARARESARKTQCLANVKNIAMAIQIYLTDYDCFLPHEHDATVRAWYLDNDIGTCDSGVTCHTNAANPYLKAPVVLDEYTKSREIWRCPSARFTQNMGVNFGYGKGQWFQYLRDMVGVDGCAGSLGPSSRAFPPGWGGSTTDSVVQGACGAGSSLFVQSVAVPWTLNELKTSAMADTSKQVAVADAGIITEQLDRTSWVAYPEDCRIDHVLCNTTCGGDWAGCSWSRPCSPQQVALGGDGKTASDAQSRKTLFGSRHLGGSNLGFCDGHAKWMSSEAILFGGENWSGYGKDPPDLYGLGVCFVPDAVNKYR